jgi:hypothetical protein
MISTLITPAPIIYNTMNPDAGIAMFFVIFLIDS